MVGWLGVWGGGGGSKLIAESKLGCGGYPKHVVQFFSPVSAWIISFIFIFVINGVKGQIMEISMTPLMSSAP